MLKKRLALLMICCILLLFLPTACGRQTNDTDEHDENGNEVYETAVQSEYDENGGEAPEAVQAMQPITEAERDENLVKLGKVWGFVKYTHNSFITGAKCWDEELLRLVPIVYNAHPSEVNGILYDWFISLGDDGYDTIVPPPVGAELRKMADLSWINYEYLGVLAAPLLRFDGTPDHLGRFRAPVTFDPIFSVPDFSRQNAHSGMDFGDIGYRLLGLFRLWNAMKYYFPHLDVLDVNWNDLLIEFIPMMLSGDDRLSYELTLAMLAHHIHDGHARLDGSTFFADKFGQYMIPAQFIAAEGLFVVYEAYGSDNPLIRGDIILGVNNRDIDEIIAEKRPFISYPDDEKALAYIAIRWMGDGPAGLRSHASSIEIDILRGGEPMTLTVDGITDWWSWGELVQRATQTHILLDNNIGLINPSLLSRGDVSHIMDEFADTDGIIIDLLQYPDGHFPREMKQFLTGRNPPFGYVSIPSQTHPGMRSDQLGRNPVTHIPNAFIYDRPVVLLMDVWTASWAETVVMFLRNAPQVTVVGSYSRGANGDMVRLPLPGGIRMSFTSIGIYTPDGGQTFRIGLEPDIRVDRTIQGIAEGRDEIMEAAIEFILGN